MRPSDSLRLVSRCSVVLVLAVGGCWEPNPAFLGPAAMTSTNGDTTTTDPTTSGPTTLEGTSGEVTSTSDSGTTASTEPTAGSSSGGGPIGCFDDGDCPAAQPLCGPPGICQAGAAGDPCEDPSDCGDAPLCGPEGCQVGAA